jgi:hypothetical protein
MIAIECMNAEELGGDETWWQIYNDSFPASQREPADVILKNLPKFDEDTSLAVNGATDVTSFADVSRVFDAAVGYPAATATGESVYPVSGR